MSFESSLLAAKISGNQTVGARLVDDNGRNIAADLTEEGMVTQQISAPRRENEANVLEVCQQLRQKLNEETSPSPWTGEVVIVDADIDGIIFGDHTEIAVQVTRPDFAGIWKTIGRGETAHVTDDFASLAESIRAAIEKKEHRQLLRSPSPLDEARQRREKKQNKRLQVPGIVLAIDCIETVGAVMGADVVNAFKTQYEDWSSHLPYTSIWLVGPVPSMSHRIK